MRNVANSMMKKLKAVSIVSLCVVTASVSFAHTLEISQQDRILQVLAEGDLAKVEQVFESGIDINETIEGDGTPLIIAVQNANKALVKLLLEKGADVNRESIPDGNPLIVAALTNNVDLVDYLYKQGAQIDAIVEHDETALISASRAGHFEVVKFLVEHGANVNLAVQAKTIRGTELRSPLNGAKTEEIREYLLVNGARS